MPETSLIKFHIVNLCNHYQTKHWLNKGLWALILLMCGLFLLSYEEHTLKTSLISVILHWGFSVEFFFSWRQSSSFRGRAMNASDILINAYLAVLSREHWEFLLPCRPVEKSVNHKISSHLISSPYVTRGKEIAMNFLF